VKAIDLLLKFGADPSTGDSNLNTCLYYAIKSGSISLIQKFIALGNNPISLRNNHQGANSLQVAIAFSQYDAAKYLITNVSLNQQALKKGFIHCICKHISNFTFDQRKALIHLMIGYGLEINNHPDEEKTFLQEMGGILVNFPEMRDFLTSLGAE